MSSKHPNIASRIMLITYLVVVDLAYCGIVTSVWQTWDSVTLRNAFAVLGIVSVLASIFNVLLIAAIRSLRTEPVLPEYIGIPLVAKGKVLSEPASAARPAVQSEPEPRFEPAAKPSVAHTKASSRSTRMQVVIVFAFVVLAVVLLWCIVRRKK